MDGIGRAEAARFERDSRCFERDTKCFERDTKGRTRCFGHDAKIPTLPSSRFGCAT
jgi:hypothetical protein